MKFSIAAARQLLATADVFFGTPGCEQTLNVGDTFAWGCGDGEDVTDEELPRVAELFLKYGWCGILYWVAVEKRGWDEPYSEFENVHRFIQFVRNEEKVCKDIPKPSVRAYHKFEYALGGKP